MINPIDKHDYPIYISNIYPLNIPINSHQQSVRMASSGMAMAYAMIVKGYAQQKARSHETFS